MVVLSCDVLTLALKLYIPVYIWLSLMSLLHSHGLASELISLESSWKLVASLQLVFVSVSLKSQVSTLSNQVLCSPCGQRSQLLCSPLKRLAYLAFLEEIVIPAVELIF